MQILRCDNAHRRLESLEFRFLSQAAVSSARLLHVDVLKVVSPSSHQLELHTEMRRQKEKKTKNQKNKSGFLIKPSVLTGSSDSTHRLRHMQSSHNQDAQHVMVGTTGTLPPHSEGSFRAESCTQRYYELLPSHMGPESL
jgi:hypothetical protein